MPRRGQDLPRPTPRSTYRVLVRNSEVAKDWETLLRTRRELCIRLWDHIAASPLTPVGSRYTPLRGNLRQAGIEGELLPQWQWEIDNNARVKVAIGRDFVIVVSVSFGHPKENE